MNIKLNVLVLTSVFYLVGCNAVDSPQQTNTASDALVGEEITQTDLVSDTSLNTNSETQLDIESETDTNTKTESQPDTQTQSETNSGTDTDSITLTETNSSIETNTLTETDSQIETVSQTDTDIQTQTFTNVEQFDVPAKIEFEHYHRYFDTDELSKGDFFREDAVDFQLTQDVGGGLNIGWFVPTEWLAFDINVLEKAQYQLLLRVALNRDDTQISILINDNEIKNVPIPNTGDWQTWATLDVDLGELAKGEQEIKFLVQNSGVNVNWFELKKLEDELEPDLDSQYRPGDQGVTFDETKFDPRFPQMQHWITAGVRGGIPSIESHEIKSTLDGGNSDDINQAINDVSNLGGGAVFLKDGIYNITKQITMKSNVVLIGESRDKTIAIIDMDNGNAFLFGKDVRHSGIYRLTMEGIWGAPKYNWNIGDGVANNELDGNENVTVMFKDSIDSWLDDVNIYNSADFPVRCNATHITFRGLDVNGVHNKQGGAHGYFFILNGYNLITQSKMTHLRHISLQGGDVEYNVLYDNDLAQEVSYHSGDDGNNLIENNRIVLPGDMPNGTNGPDYRAIMGPWSSQHHKSKTDNFNYNNQIGELNHNHPVGSVLSGDDRIFAGPIFDNSKGEQQAMNFPAMLDENSEFIVPLHGTLYPIVLK